jgi:hypothetical protein
MNTPDPPVALSAIHVRWSDAERIFVARSDQYPALAYHHESSLAALNGLIDTIYAHLRARSPTGHSHENS